MKKIWLGTEFYYRHLPAFDKQLTEEQLYSKLLSRIKVTEDGCWEWTRSKDKDGYGWFYGGRKSKSGHRFNEKAHRVSLSFKLGREIKEGYKALHTCDNPPCINPAHLYEGTQFDNERDKINRRRHANHHKTHCPAGHEYNDANTYYRPGYPEWRDCRPCRNEASRRRRQSGLTSGGE